MGQRLSHEPSAHQRFRNMLRNGDLRLVSPFGVPIRLRELPQRLSDWYLVDPGIEIESAWAIQLEGEGDAAGVIERRLEFRLLEIATNVVLGQVVKKAPPPGGVVCFRALGRLTGSVSQQHREVKARLFEGGQNPASIRLKGNGDLKLGWSEIELDSKWPERKPEGRSDTLLRLEIELPSRSQFELSGLRLEWPNHDIIGVETRNSSASCRELLHGIEHRITAQRTALEDLQAGALRACAASRDEIAFLQASSEALVAKLHSLRQRAGRPTGSPTAQDR